MTLRHRVSPGDRLERLQERLDETDHVKVIEAHNGLSALVGEEASVQRNGTQVEFDAFWASSFTGTAAQGMPDAEVLGYRSRSETIEEILNVTSKPVIVDGDTGGSRSQFEYFVKRLERLGVSGVIIEDKVFPKRNSLDGSAKQTQEDPETFARKIRAGERAALHDDFTIISRIESLIAGKGVADAVDRAETYLDAGVDGVMIHTSSESAAGVIEFAERYNELCARRGRRPPLVCVPTTYNDVTDRELSDVGFDVIIHANHLLRSAHRAMEETAAEILRNGRNREAEPNCSPVEEVFETVGLADLQERGSGGDETTPSEREQVETR